MALEIRRLRGGEGERTRWPGERVWGGERSRERESMEGLRGELKEVAMGSAVIKLPVFLVFLELIMTDWGKRFEENSTL